MTSPSRRNPPDLRSPSLSHSEHRRPQSFASLKVASNRSSGDGGAGGDDGAAATSCKVVG
jgi:hypothetical protein